MRSQSPALNQIRYQSLSRVELRHHHIAVSARILSNVLVLFLCFYFQCHNLFVFQWFVTKGSGQIARFFHGRCDVFQFSIRPSSIILLPYQIRLLYAPIRQTFLSLPWARKISLVGAQVFSFIDVAKVLKKEMQNKLFSNLSQIYFNC